jgi:hypothetical protein
VTSSQGTSLRTDEVCAQIKHIGFAASKRVRIYGEEFEVLSDPFPSANGIAIHVRSQRTSETRVLQLPATMIQRGNQSPVRAA